MDEGARHRIGGARRTMVGVLLLCLAAFAFSTAGLFTRIVPVGLWAMLFWRNAFGCLGLAFVLLVRRGESLKGLRLAPRRRLAAMGLSSFGTICYLAAFTRTSVADIAIFYATAPMLTATLAWHALGERPMRRTLVAAALALLGVVVTVAGSTARGSLAGDGLAFLMPAALSAVAVLARGAALPPLTTALGSSALAAIAALGPVWLDGAGLVMDGRDALWLAGFGFITMTIALPAYLAGAARVSAGRTMLISAIELPFAPFWVWLAFGELPQRASLFGGAIVVVAIVYDLRGRGS